MNTRINKLKKVIEAKVDIDYLDNELETIIELVSTISGEGTGTDMTAFAEKRKSKKEEFQREKRESISDSLRQEMEAIVEEWPTLTKRFYEMKKSFDDSGAGLARGSFGGGSDNSKVMREMRRIEQEMKRGMQGLVGKGNNSVIEAMQG